MSQFTWPLGGDVSQAWSWWLNQSLRQFGLINIEQTVSSDPELERRIVTEVAGYGKQLGRIIEALQAVLEHSQKMPFTPEEKNAISRFTQMAAEIANVKQRHGSNVEELLDHVIEEAKDKRDSQMGRRLIDRMREAVSTLDTRPSDKRSDRTLEMEPNRIVASKRAPVKLTHRQR